MRQRRPRERHGMHGTPEYRAWAQMVLRCTNPDASDWPRYGGRGIAVDPTWRDSFAAFYAHVGARPSAGHSLDRIDNAGNYEPGNVRWATRLEQQRNLRTNLSAEIVTAVRADPRSSRVVAAALGIAHSSVQRIRRGERWQVAQSPKR